jgi:hypothetical protein
MRERANPLIRKFERISKDLVTHPRLTAYVTIQNVSLSAVPKFVPMVPRCFGGRQSAAASHGRFFGFDFYKNIVAWMLFISIRIGAAAEHQIRGFAVRAFEDAHTDFGMRFCSVSFRHFPLLLWFALQKGSIRGLYPTTFVNPLVYTFCGHQGPSIMTLSAAPIAEGIAKDARENLDGVDVCHVGPLFVDEDDKCQFLHCYVVLPKDGGKTFAANVVTLSHIEEPWFAKVNRQALIVCLEPLFARVQIFGDELAFAKYCQGQWPSDAINKVVSDIIKARGLN